MKEAQKYVIAIAAALLLAYAVTLTSSGLIFSHNNRQPLLKSLYKIRNNRYPETIRKLWSYVLFWRSKCLYTNSAMFSVFPPFYYGLHNALMGCFTLLLVLLMHIFGMARRFDKERSSWPYFYYFYHLSIGIWIEASLIVGYVQSQWGKLIGND